MLGSHPGSTSSPIAPETLCTSLVAALRELGVEQAFGVVGGAISSFCHAIVHSPIQYLHFRHETGATFAALEASLASGRPTLVFTTAGPGLTNALTGICAARWEGAHVILVSACSSPAHRGRVATQETGPTTLPTTLFLGGAPFHYATVLDHPAQLEPVVAELARGLRRPHGFVAHVSLPIAVQTLAPRPLRVPLARVPTPSVDPALARHVAALLHDQRFVIWVGHGARHAAAPIRALAERTGARVMSSPRGKGIFPEDHPLFLGVTGLGGHTEVDDALVAERPTYTLVLGTKLGESTSFWARELIPSEAFVHVDVDASAFAAAFPDVPTHGIEADVGCFVSALLEVWPESPRLRSHAPALPRPPAPDLRERGEVRPQALFAALQHIVVEGSDAIVMAESGNSFCWATNLLRFATPGRYRVSTGFGSMGHAATGVVGAALARQGKAIALLGDGAMLMSCEIHTAVQYGAKAIWVVLNDACYLMCEQGMQMLGWQPFATRLGRVDFVAFARSLGAEGEHVEHETQLDAALQRALAAAGPYVLDVTIDSRELAPSGRRHKTLLSVGS
jgi:acetolactate synthase-1/2/3 large subunit